MSTYISVDPRSAIRPIPSSSLTSLPLSARSSQTLQAQDQQSLQKRQAARSEAHQWAGAESQAPTGPAGLGRRWGRPGAWTSWSPRLRKQRLEMPAGPSWAAPPLPTRCPSAQCAPTHLLLTARRMALTARMSMIQGHTKTPCLRALPAQLHGQIPLRHSLRKHSEGDGRPLWLTQPLKSARRSSMRVWRGMQRHWSVRGSPVRAQGA